MPWLLERQRIEAVMMHFRCWYHTTSAIVRQYSISWDTVLRRLCQCHKPIWPRWPYIGPMLSQSHHRIRLNLAQLHFRWQRLQWNRIILSDESLFNLYYHDRRVRVYRHRVERFAFRGKGLMGAASWCGMGLWQTERQILSLFKATLMPRVTLTKYWDQWPSLLSVPLALLHWYMAMQGPTQQAIHNNFLMAMEIMLALACPLTRSQSHCAYIWDGFGHRVRSRHIINMIHLAGGME